MPRDILTDLAAILALPERNINWTLDITFPDTTTMNFATAPLDLFEKTYTNDLETVGEIRQTLESPADRVQVGLQNKDLVLGRNLAANWQLWRKAEARIGRLYSNKSRSLTSWREMFTGSVQQPVADDMQVRFDMIPDTLTPGEIVANGTLAMLCRHVYKDPRSCAYDGDLPTCNRHLKSPGGCDGHINMDGRPNNFHFGGMENRAISDGSVPGTGGNTGGSGGSGGGSGGGNPCPTLDMFTLIEKGGRAVTQQVAFLTAGQRLWNPVDRKFQRIKEAEIVRDQPIWETITANGAVSRSSFSHPLIRTMDDRAGIAASKTKVYQHILTLIEMELAANNLIFSRDTGEKADVMKIEMENGHIYAAGAKPRKLQVCHNAKNNPLDGPVS